MPIAPRVFVVHVWAGDSAFRARARAADAEQPSDFDNPQALVDFLHQGARAGLQNHACPPAAPAQAPIPRE